MLTNNLLVLKKTILGLAVGWTLLIAFLCLISFNDIPDIEVKSADKFVHAIFYFVLVMLWGIYSMLKLDEIRVPKIILLVIGAVLYGILLEVLQGTLTATRHADAIDVLANSIGALLALMVFLFIKRQQAQKH
jgi:VanZ family protein